MAENLFAVPKQVSAGVVSAGVRLTAVQLKQEINDSGICHVVLKMAKSGKRPILQDDDKTVVWEEMSEAAHIDILKFMVKKVLPDAKEYDSVDDRKALDKWAAVIEAVPVEG